ncbi:hypothetical protein ACIGBH_04055 [Streptomyces sp. NPDC085929]|nr:hypothetical protein OG513_13940 [Streptomyces sp. NBC_00998]
MKRPTRQLTAVLLCACTYALAVGGCAAPGGLGAGEPRRPSPPSR